MKETETEYYMKIIRLLCFLCVELDGLLEQIEPFFPLER